MSIQNLGVTAPSAIQPQAASVSNEALVMAAVHMPNVFNDERDGILTKWNQLQVSTQRCIYK